MLRSKSYLLEDEFKLSSESERLEKQARILFDIDKPILDEILYNHNEIFDLGAGKGSYLKIIKESYPDKIFHAVDHNANLLGFLREDRPDINIIESDLLDVENYLNKARTKNPLLLFRFVWQHMQKHEINNLLKRLSSNREFSILVIDIDSSSLSLSPENDSVTKVNSLVNNYQMNRGGDRNIGKEISKIMSQCGLKDQNEMVLKVGEHNLSRNNFAEIFFPIWNCLNNEPEQKKILDSLLPWKENFINRNDYNMSYNIHFVYAGKE